MEKLPFCNKYPPLFFCNIISYNFSLLECVLKQYVRIVVRGAQILHITFKNNIIIEQRYSASVVLSAEASDL